MQNKIFPLLGAAIVTLAKGVALGIAMVGCVVLGAIGAYKYIHHIVSPDIEKFLHTEPAQSTKLYAKDGTLLYEIYQDVKRTYVPLHSISPHVQHATIAIEDKDFYRHDGISIPALVRSAFLDYYAGDTIYGGSTITQQLVKNSILTPEKSVIRKVAEIIWARELEKNLSKEEILERYLNLVPYGRNTAGIEAAAQSYFGKSAKDLTIAESAYLSALPQAPSLYNPDGKNRALLDGRARYIIKIMAEQGYIDQKIATTTQLSTVQFHPRTEPILAPHFVLWLKGELIKELGEETVLSGGLRVYTSLDLDLQGLAESTVKEYAAKNTLQYRAANAALVAIEPGTGQVLAMVGSRDYFGTPEPKGCRVGSNCYFDPNTNVALSLRQPGSSFKPHVYATAFGEEFKFTPATLVADISKNFSSAGATPYRPRNYNGAQYGWIPVRKALAGSLNIAAVHTLSKIGTEPVIAHLRSMGVTAPLSGCGLSLALGSCELTLLEHTNGFATYANLGKYNPVTGIVKIEDPHNKIIFQQPPQNQQIMPAAAAYELIDILTDNDARAFIFGKNSPLTLRDRKVAAKTGTTQDWKDGWTLGFTPELAVGVWTGNNDGSLMKPGADGVFTAAPIWNKFMSEALKNVPPSNFAEPYGISRVAVDSRGRIIKPRSVRQKMEVMADYAIPVVAINPIAPRVLSVRAPKVPQDSNGAETTVILEPYANQIIKTNPFEVKVYTGSSTLETTVDLLIDGKIVATKTTAPFLFTVPDNLKNGWHTLTARARHFNSFESEHTVRVKTFFNPPPISPRGEAGNP